MQKQLKELTRTKDAPRERSEGTKTMKKVTNILNSEMHLSVVKQDERRKTSDVEKE